MISSWMGHHHAHGKSVLHRMPASVKLGAALCLIVATLLAPRSWVAWHVGTAALLVLAILVSGLPLGFIGRRLLVLSPFVLGVALVNAFQSEDPARWRWLAIKSTLSLVTVILVANTTPFSRILKTLRCARVPGLLITTIALMHRYLFVLADEAERMRRARMSRTFARNRGSRWLALSSVIGHLFVRASERAERIYDAMCARGWR
jgi:cobalt/nickel transport system permease protein